MIAPPTLPGIHVVRLEPGDGPEIVALYQGLSEASRALRFGTPMPTLPAHVLARLSDVDGHRHVALGARSSVGLVGVVHRIRAPLDPTLHEVALVVADAHQGQGIGDLLLRAVARDAERAGVLRLGFHLSGGNRAMARLLARHGVRVEYRAGEGAAIWTLGPEALVALSA